MNWRALGMTKEIARRFVEHPTRAFVCGCCGYKAVDADDLLEHSNRRLPAPREGGES